MRADEVRKAMAERKPVRTSIGGKVYQGEIVKEVKDGFLFNGIRGNERIIAKVISSSDGVFPVEEVGNE